MSFQPEPGATGPWRPTVAHVRAVGVAIVLCAIALLAGRPDLLVIATPFAVVAAWSTVTRPHTQPVVRDRFGNPSLREGDATTWHADVHDLDEAVDLLTAQMSPVPWVETIPEGGAATASVERGVVPTISIALRSLRWGRRSIEPIRLSAVSHWGAFECRSTSEHRSLHTLPLPAAFDSRAPLRPGTGLVGLSRASRSGEGSEFAGIRQFAVGDRMRRINWPRSLSSNDGLLVNATWADQDTHVAFVVDAVADYGSSEGVDGAASSLDTTVRAAGAIAEHVIGRGDRVSLRTFGTAAQQTIPPAAGAAHLRRVLDALTRLRSLRGTTSANRSRRTRPMREGGAELTVMLSPMISREALDQAVALGSHGATVVIIDTLPDDIAVDPDPYVALAWRIRILERRREIRRVQQVGIPVVRWRGPGSLDQFLRDAARRASAPRMRVR